MDLNTGNYEINNISYVNIILGKNGSGKSTLLRNLQTHIQGLEESGHRVSYITPERGGVLSYEANIEHTIRSNPKWITNERRKNQASNFRQQTVARFRDLESVIQREMERLVDGGGQPVRDGLFERYVEKINSLLENIEIRRDTKIFSIYKKGTDDVIDPTNISSGESELIALAIEVLVFNKEEGGTSKFLLLDEPDVHLHPDLQVKFTRFIHELTDDNFRVIIATHSTAILGALEEKDNVNVAFITNGETQITFKPIKDSYKKFLPVFGAHPLSNIFNEAPVLLVEGEDEERIWQTAVRSSTGAIKIFPCVCGDVQSITTYETDVSSVINAVYNDATAYSLRDKDEGDEQDLDDVGPVIRFKLKCRASENLLLSNEVLAGTEVLTWDTLEERIDAWIISNTTHTHHALMNEFKEGGYDRKNFNLKRLRNILIGIIGDTKSWEVVVGRGLAHLTWSDTTDFEEENSLHNYLGEKIVNNLFPKTE